MKYKNIISGTFIDRPNRFIAHVLVNGKKENVHVKNTGRCRELLIPGAKVILETADNPDRKTKYDLIAVYKNSPHLGDGVNAVCVNMDSQAPNKVVYEWLAEREMYAIKPEFTYGNSRIDFYFENHGRKSLMEVKGVTLEREGIAYFPDAPTLRGVKHMEELIRAKKEGFDSYIAFVIQMEGVDEVYANIDTHPEFGEVLEKAKNAGVRVLALGCSVKEDEIFIDRSREM